MDTFNTNEWNEFKESVRKAGFSTIRLDDEKRDLKQSDDIFKLDVVEKYLATDQLEELSYIDIMDMANSYVEEKILSQLKDEDGSDDWYDETYEMWQSAFEYAALFNRLIAFEVECKFR